MSPSVIGRGGQRSAVPVFHRATTTAAVAMAAAIFLAGSGAGGALALFADTEQVAATSSTAASFSNTTYWLHNNPTPPSGNTNMQADLVMNTTAPTATTLFNYDADQDSSAGRLVLRGGSGAGETDLSQYQNWRGPTAPLLGQSINGAVTVEFWSGMRDFTGGTAGDVRVFLRNFDTVLGLTTEIANTTIASADWQGGSTGWVKKIATFNVNTTLLVGHKLEVKLIVGGGAADDMWLAYDTTIYRSRVRLP
jgi:hypothetical protein